jgi:two-component system response regulator FlrC
MVLAVDGIIEVDHLLLETHSHQEDLSSLNQEEILKQIDPVFSREQQQAAALRDVTIEESASEAWTSTQPQQANEGLSDLTWKSESRVIIDTLSRFSGNRKNTAEQLGISPRTLRYKLARLKEEGVALP